MRWYTNRRGDVLWLQTMSNNVKEPELFVKENKHTNLQALSLPLLTSGCVSRCVSSCTCVAVTNKWLKSMYITKKQWSKDIKEQYVNLVYLKPLCCFHVYNVYTHTHCHFNPIFYWIRSLPVCWNWPIKKANFDTPSIKRLKNVLLHSPEIIDVERGERWR